MQQAEKKILLLDSTGTVRQTIAPFLTAGANQACTTTASFTEAFDLCIADEFDVILVNNESGHPIDCSSLKTLCEIKPKTAVLVLTDMPDDEQAIKFVKNGAQDVLSMTSIDQFLFRTAVSLAIERAKILNEIRSSENATRRIQPVTTMREDSAFESTIEAFALTLELRDPYAEGHHRNVRKLARAIAIDLGLNKDQIDAVTIAGLLHDIGKIAVPSSILNKPGPLTNAEFDIVKTHPKVGYEILKKFEFPWPLAAIVLGHHEKQDGSGYPFGLKNDRILIESKIISVADVVQAMASHRPYRPPFSIERALHEIESHRDTLFHRDSVESCIKLFKKNNYTFE